jgi:hypothetical protein
VLATNLVPRIVVPEPPTKIITRKLKINLVLRENGALSLISFMRFINHHHERQIGNASKFLSTQAG